MLKNRVIIVFFIFILFIVKTVSACMFCIDYTLEKNFESVWYEQERARSNIGFSKEINQDYEKEKKRSSSFLTQTNPFKMVFVGLIRAYQFFLSPLDGSSCQFRPSCSHYATEAIRDNPVKGLFLTGDRLIRCNPFTPGTYNLTEDGNYHYDPVEDYELKFKDVF